MAVEALSVESICVILNACQQNGVVKFSYAGLRVEFQNPCAAGNAAVGFNSSLGGETPLDVGTEGKPSILPSVSLTEEDRQVLEDARMGQLMVDDPLGYEQEMIDQLGDLNNDSEDSGGTQ